MSYTCYDAATGKEVRKMNDYDERQILARGRAFMWGFFSLMICLMVYGLTDMLIEPWCDTLTGCIICICVSLIVFAVICIRQDAFAGIGQKRKRNLTVLLVLTAANLLFGVSHHLRRGPAEGRAAEFPLGEPDSGRHDGAGAAGVLVPRAEGQGRD